MHAYVWRLGAAVALLPLCGFFPMPAWSHWRQSPIAGARLHPSALRFDAAGSPHLALGGGPLRHALRTTVGWTIENVPAPATASDDYDFRLDAAGSPVFAYYDTYRHGVVLLRRGAAGWADEVVELSPSVDGGAGVSLRLDAAGRPALSYRRAPGGAVRFARHDGVSWSLASVDPAATGERATSLALDPAGQPLISYANADGSLRLARFDGAAWSLETLAPAGSAATDTRIACDGSGRIAIAYGTSPDAGLKIARSSGSGWSIDTLETADARMSDTLEFDSRGELKLAYVASLVDPLLKLMVHDGVAWREEVRTPVDDGHAAVAIDAQGRPVAAIEYTPTVDSRFYYRFFDGTAWRDELILEYPRPRSWCGAAAGPGGELHVGFHNGTLRVSDTYYATGDASGWSVFQADSAAGGDGVSAGLDASLRPVLAYFSWDYNLDVSTWDGSSWYRQSAVWGIRYADGQTSLARAPTGEPAVAATDATTYELHYAAFDGASWRDEVAVRDAGESPSLAFDSAGRPAIACTDSSQQSALLERWTGSAWDVTTVTTGAWLRYVCLAFDPSGRPAMGIQDQGGERLLYAADTGLGWQLEVVDTGIDFEVPCVLRFDPAGAPLIAYSDDESLSVKLGRRLGSRWSTEVVDPWLEVEGNVNLLLDAGGHPRLVYIDDDQHVLWLMERTDWSYSILKGPRPYGLAPVGQAVLAWVDPDPPTGPGVTYYQVELLDRAFWTRSGSSVRIEP